MQKFWALYKKEMMIFFSLPIAYAVMTVYMALSGYFFSAITGYYSMMSMRAMQSYGRSQQMDINLMEGIFRGYFSNLIIILLLIMPLLTMRVFSEEKREGTAELLFSYPISDFTVVAAKFFSVFSVFAIIVLSSISSVIVLGTATKDIELVPLLVGYLGVLMVGGAFIMLGIFISSLTESQIVAGVITFGASLLLWVLSWGADMAGAFWGKILNTVSVIAHFDSFSKGTLDTADIIYYINFIVLFFFLTLRMLESKQWRG